MQIFESRTAPLYHHMEFVKMENVFTNDIMPARWEHEIPGMGLVKGNSFSRNPRRENNKLIGITVDQFKLAHTHRIIPLDGQNAFFKQFSNIEGMKNRNRREHELLMEEFVIGDIKNLHLYITKIEMLYTDGFYGLAPYNRIEAYKIVRAYSKKWKIPFKVAPDVLRDNIETLRRWRDPDY